VEQKLPFTLAEEDSHAIGHSMAKMRRATEKVVAFKKTALQDVDGQINEIRKKLFEIEAFTVVTSESIDRELEKMYEVLNKYGR